VIRAQPSVMHLLAGGAQGQTGASAAGHGQTPHCSPCKRAMAPATRPPALLSTLMISYALRTDCRQRASGAAAGADSAALGVCRCSKAPCCHRTAGGCRGGQGPGLWGCRAGTAPHLALLDGCCHLRISQDAIIQLRPVAVHALQGRGRQGSRQGAGRVKTRCGQGGGERAPERCARRSCPEG
jgi:hypothetical protein